LILLAGDGPSEAAIFPAISGRFVAAGTAAKPFRLRRVAGMQPLMVSAWLAIRIEFLVDPVVLVTAFIGILAAELLVAAI
jgi:hypothetical protein